MDKQGTNISPNEEQSDSKTLKHKKNSSMRDIILGKRIPKSLPCNFFEQIIDLELKLKREFTMDTLKELVNLYSVI
jgi:hypothetical protein